MKYLQHCSLTLVAVCLGYTSNLSAQTSDPLFNNQSHLESTNDIDIDAPEAWLMAKGLDKHEIIVAIIDSAIDTRNADLKNRQRLI